MQELLVQWPKETVFEKNNIKIEIEDFTLKYYENNEFKIESNKKYYSDLKIVLDEKRKQYYVLDCEGSCIDIYSYPEFQYKSSHGKKQYWEDYLKEIKLRYFDGKDIDSTLTQLKLFFPKDMILREDGLYIWDERNLRVVNINLDNVTQQSFIYLDNQIKKVFFDTKKIRLLKESENEEFDYNKDFIDLTKNYRDILKELYKKEKLETYEEIIKEIENEEIPINNGINCRNRVIESYFFNNEEISKLKYIMSLPSNCSNITYNPDKDEILMIENKQKSDYKVILLDDKGFKYEITGLNKKFKRISDVVYYNENYWLMEGGKGKNNIIKIKTDKTIEVISDLNKYSDKNFIRIRNMNENLYVYSNNSGEIFSLDDISHKLEKDYNYNLNDNFFLKFYFLIDKSRYFILKKKEILAIERLFVDDLRYEDVKLIKSSNLIYLKDETYIFDHFLMKIYKIKNKKIDFININPGITEIFVYKDKLCSYLNGKIYKLEF